MGDLNDLLQESLGELDLDIGLVEVPESITIKSHPPQEGDLGLLGLNANGCPVSLDPNSRVSSYGWILAGCTPRPISDQPVITTFVNGVEVASLGLCNISYDHSSDEEDGKDKEEPSRNAIQEASSHTLRR